MPYIPHTADDVEQMLATIGVQSIDELYDEIPSALRVDQLHGIPNGINEMQATRLATELARRDHYQLNFIGAGAYEHHIPAAVWDIASRGEFLTCYTPYQAEASQGTLQLLYEFQTMIASLTGMDVANASLYDGASALAEAILMAVRCHRQSQRKRILLPGSLHPYYRRTVESLVSHQGIECLTIDFCPHTGKLVQQQLAQYAEQDITAMVIAQPNFFGVLDDVDALTQWCESNNSKVIACVNPLSLAVLKEPGQWGQHGADIVCGELQPFGMPLSSGGPYAGFLCCKQTLVRQMPGRIIGRTVDSDGNEGFVLTLQAREQHIRRSKATSNICTNQGLLVTAATLYMSLLGADGLQRVAQQCHANCQYLVEKIAAIDGVKLVFPNPWFHEVVLQFDQDVAVIIDSLAQQHILAGFNLSTHYPQLPNSLLVCVTETKTSADIDSFVHALQHCLQECSPC